MLDEAAYYYLWVFNAFFFGLSLGICRIIKAKLEQLSLSPLDFTGFWRISPSP